MYNDYISSSLSVNQTSVKFLIFKDTSVVFQTLLLYFLPISIKSSIYWWVYAASIILPRKCT